MKTKLLKKLRNQYTVDGKQDKWTVHCKGIPSAACTSELSANEIRRELILHQIWINRH